MNNSASHVSLSHPRTKRNETNVQVNETRCETPVRQPSLKALARKALGRDTTRDAGEKTSHSPVRQTGDNESVSCLTYPGMRHETNQPHDALDKWIARDYAKRKAEFDAVKTAVLESNKERMK